MSNTEQTLTNIAEEWLQQQIESWFSVYGSWDMLIDEYDITTEDYDWIQNNVKYEFTAIKIGD